MEKKMIRNGHIVTVVLASFVTVFAATCIYAQATAFSYQGSLMEGGIAANGPYDMEFKLFDAAEAGNQVESTIQLDSVTVANGIFAVELDFGEAFPGAARFLEIGISPSGMNNYTTLSPRQKIGSSPYSVKTLKANTAETAGNSEQLGGVAASQYVQTSESLRIVRGNVGGGSIPQILAGTGFTIGPLVPFDDKITILYETPFPSPPSVVVTSQGSSRTFATLRDSTVAVPATHGFMVSFYLDTGTPAPVTPFHFIVMGPR